MGMGKCRDQKVYIGIDPGINGAIAAIFADGTYHVDSVPSVILNDKRNFDPSAMAALIKKYGCASEIFLESVHAMPGNGAVSMFFFGRGFGIWEGVLGALNKKHTLISPQQWKKGYPELAPVKGDPRTRAQIKAAAKKNALILARNIFPKISHLLKREKDDGRAEALLMALYAAKQDGLTF